MTLNIVMEIAVSHKCNKRQFQIDINPATDYFAITLLAGVLISLLHISNIRGNELTSPVAEHPDVLFVEGLLNAGFVDVAIETCRGRYSIARETQPEAASHWSMLLMQSITAKIASAPAILDEPKSIPTMLVEVKELADQNANEPRALWLSHKYLWCRWFILRRSLAAYLAVPARQNLREWSLESIRSCADELEQLQLQIQQGPGRNAKLASKGQPTPAQWTSLINDSYLLQADLLYLRALFYPAKSTERLGTATEMLTSLDKAMSQINESWSGRPGVELARCSALVLLDRPQEALDDLMKLKKRLDQPTDTKQKPSNRWRQRIATLAAEANRNLGKINDSNLWIESVGGWTQAPEIAIEHFANLVAAPRGRITSEAQLAQAIELKREIGKRFGAYWQQRADAILVSNNLLMPEPPPTSGKLPVTGSAKLKIELLLTEAKQLLAAKQWQKAIEKLKQAEISAANSNDDSSALDFAINAAAVSVINGQHEIAQAEFHRAALEYRNAPKAPDAALMSVWNFEGTSTPSLNTTEREATFTKRLMDVVTIWPSTPQAETAIVRLDKFLLATDQLPALLDLWSQRVDQLTIDSLNQEIETQRLGIFDRAFARFTLVNVATQDAWFDHTIYSQQAYMDIQIPFKNLQSILTSKSAVSWRSTTEATLNSCVVASRWPQADIWPVVELVGVNVPSRIPIGLAVVSGAIPIGSDSPTINSDTCVENALIWARAELVYQQAIRKGVAGPIDPELQSQLRLCLDKMKSQQPEMGERQRLQWKRSMGLYEAAIPCWTGEHAKGVAMLETARKQDSKSPWWPYRTARLFQTLDSQREQAIKQFRSLANGFSAGSEAWLEFRARTAQTMRQMGNEQTAKELADLVFATYPGASTEWATRFSGRQ